MLKSINTFDKRLKKAFRKNNKITIEEIIALDQTILEFVVPRLKIFHESVKHIKEEQEWVSRIQRLIILGDTILETKRNHNLIEIVNEDLIIDKSEINFDSIEESKILDNINRAKEEQERREEFKKLFFELFFTLYI